MTRPLVLLLPLLGCDIELGCPEGTHLFNEACVDDKEPEVSYPDSPPDDSATDDSATDDSATDDSATDDSTADCDVDGDGVLSLGCGGTDCDDEDPSVYPDAIERWDGVDNDCEGSTDRSTIAALSIAYTSGSALDDRITAIDNLAGGQDLTGDGVPDIAIGAPVFNAWDGAVMLLDGAKVSSWTGDARTDALLLVTGTGGTDNLGFVPDTFGDLNQDGVADLLVGARAASGVGAAYVFFGGEELSGARTSADADLTIQGGAGGLRAGFAVESASDLDGDGVTELIVSDPSFGAGGRVGLFRTLPTGSAVSLDDADALLTGTAGERLGESLSGGDLDEDGYAELILGAPGSGSGNGDVVVVPGGATLPSGDIASAQSLRVTGSQGGQMGGNSRGLARPADLDSSGLPDLVLSDYQGAGAVMVFLDPGTGTLRDVDAPVILQQAGTTLGSSVVTGDLNADGVPDVLVGAYEDSTLYNNGGAAFAIWGGADLSAGARFTRDSADAVLEATGEDQLLGTALSFTGDLSGDGHNDWLVGSSWDDALAEKGGTVHLIEGR